ncbi:MAG: exodeoxyribonuclease VII small subunit [Bdellovibrionia bacterium]
MSNPNDSQNLNAKSPESTPAAEKASFESSLLGLQKVVKSLESGELALDEALKQFEEGVKLTRVCQQYLTAAEQRVELLMKADGSGVETQPFLNPRFSGPESR